MRARRVTAIVDAFTLFDATTDAGGSVHWADAPSNPPGLKVEKAGSVCREVTGGATPGLRVFEIVPRTVRSVALRVLDADSRERLMQFDVGFARQHRAVQDGEFSMDVDSDETLSVTVRADGHIAETVQIDADSGSEVEVLLKPGDAVAGVLRTADGTVLADTPITQWRKRPQSISIYKSVELQGGKLSQTDADGRFFFEHGYAMADAQAIVESGELVVSPPARIEGTCPREPGDAGKQEIGWTSGSRNNKDSEFPRIQLSTKLGEDGRFAIENVPPIEGWMALEVQESAAIGSTSSRIAVRYLYPRRVVPKSGDTLHVDLTPAGRPVVGRIELSEPLGARQSLVVRMAPRQSDDSRHPSAPGSVVCTSDGAFRYSDVVPGEYSLEVDWIGPGKHDRFEPRRVSVLDEASREPYDLGTLASEAPKGEGAAADWPRVPQVAVAGADGELIFTGLRYGAIGLLAVAIGGWWLRRHNASRAKGVTGGKHV